MHRLDGAWKYTVEDGVPIIGHDLKVPRCRGDGMRYYQICQLPLLLFLKHSTVVRSWRLAFQARY